MYTLWTFVLLNCDDSGLKYLKIFVFKKEVAIKAIRLNDNHKK